MRRRPKTPRDDPQTDSSTPARRLARYGSTARRTTERRARPRRRWRRGGSPCALARCASVEILDLPLAVLAHELHGAAGAVGHRGAVTDLFELGGGKGRAQRTRNAGHLFLLRALPGGAKLVGVEPLHVRVGNEAD